MSDKKQLLPSMRFKPTLSTWAVGLVVLIFIISGAASSGFGGLLIMLGVAALLTALYTFATGRKGWAKLPSRKVAAMTLAVSIFTVGMGGAIVGPGDDPNSVPLSLRSEIEPPHPSPSLTPSAIPEVATVEFTEEDPGDPPIVTAPNEKPSVVAADRTVTSTTALALLATLPIKGKAPKTGYDRTRVFGQAWLDIDRNGCDTRNDILARDFTSFGKSGTCTVLSGVLSDPYTAKLIHFIRGENTSSLVQIDHVVSLSNAWQTGAQQLTQAQRISLANDPINLFAVDGPINLQKGAGDTATWLPPNKSFRCTYVARQVSVKATYGLWVAPAEHDAMASILSNCENQRAVSSTFTPAPPPPSAPIPIKAPAPEAPPAPPAPAPAPPPPAPPSVGTVHPGSYCSIAGATGVTTKGTPMVCKTTSTDSRLRWRAR